VIDPRDMSVAGACDLLGVRPGADADAVRSAFRRQAQLLHPDHNGGADAEARFRAVTAARDLLLDRWTPASRGPGPGPARPAPSARAPTDEPAAAGQTTTTRPVAHGGFFRGEVDPDTLVAPLGADCLVAQVAPVRDPRMATLTASGQALLYGRAAHGEVSILDGDAALFAPGLAIALRYFDGDDAWRAIGIVERRRALVGGRSRVQVRILVAPVRLDPRTTARRPVAIDLEAVLYAADGSSTGRVVPARVFDVSPFGVGMASPAHLAVGDAVTLRGPGIDPARFAVVRGEAAAGAIGRFGAAATDEGSAAFYRAVAARSAEKRFGSTPPTAFPGTGATGPTPLLHAVDGAPLTGPDAAGRRGFHSRRPRAS
jgi:hypothetical protein